MRWLILAASLPAVALWQVHEPPPLEPRAPTPAVEPEPEERTPPAPAPTSHGGRPVQLDALAPMMGEWAISGWFAGESDARIELTGAATIAATLGGCFLEESGWFEYQDQRTEFVAMRGFDKAMSVYRFVYFDDNLALADVYEGVSADDGEVVTTNVRSETFTVSGGVPMAMRAATRLDDPRSMGFTIRWDVSTDAGENWATIGEMVGLPGRVTGSHQRRRR